MSYFFIFVNFLLAGSEKPFVWQIFAIFTRWLTVVAVWQMLNTIWPDAKRQNIFVALLATVFPGFTQQWIAVIYSFFFTCLAGFFFSVTLMLKALRTPKHFWLYYLSSILIMAYVIPASEFFIGLELIRLVILFFEFQKKELKFSTYYKKIGLYSLPYLTILGGLLVWRFFFFKSINHAFALSGWFNGNIFQVILKNLKYLYQAIIDATINTWGNPFNLGNYPSKGVTALVIPGLVIIVFIALYLLLRKFKLSPDKNSSMHVWRNQAPVLGLISMVLAILPFWSANLPIDFKFPYDRFLLAFLFGSCLIVVWLFEAIGFNEIKTVLIISMLVSIGMGYQIANANHYKNLWGMQTKFLWQLNWRIPSLEPNTLIDTYQLPENEYWSGHAVSAFINWTYTDTIIDRKLDNYFVIVNSGQENDVPNLNPNNPITINHRTFKFEGNTSQSVFVYYTTDGCLRVLDSKITPPETVIDNIVNWDGVANYSQIINTINGAKLTNLNLIKQGNGGHPPLQIIGVEPKKDWCFYFEKAEFARQENDYKQVASLYLETINAKLTPTVLTEYYPFIDSLARTGNWSAAEELTKKINNNKSPALRTGLCYLWNNLGKDFPNQKSVTQIVGDLNCP